MPLYAPPTPPNPPAAQYLWTSSAGASGTSATFGVGTLRLVPWLLSRPLTIDRIGAEITSAGDAGSKLRLGIYADTGGAYPGALLLDAGVIAGDSATTQELTVSLALGAGLYWVGAAVQVVTVTQPTVRSTGSSWYAPVTFGTGTALPSAAFNSVGYQQASVTGAFPASFSAGATGVLSAPRVLVRAA